MSWTTRKQLSATKPNIYKNIYSDTMDLDHDTVKLRIYYEFLPRLRKEGVNLTRGGHFVVGHNGYTQEKFEEDQARTKAQTLFRIHDVVKVVGLINQHMKPRKTYNTKTTSYSLKHTFEHMSSYISNGDFILAMMVCGFDPLFKQTRTTKDANPNCIFRATFQEKGRAKRKKSRKDEEAHDTSPSGQKRSKVVNHET